MNSRNVARNYAQIPCWPPVVPDGVRLTAAFVRRIAGMNAPVPFFLALLQAHAHQHGDRLLHVLPDRDITYRRLWSRTERASARLQGEWGVQAGDVVAYVGNGHPDAIVLYFALLRIGASLLPLEAVAADVARAAFPQHCARLAVQDDTAAVDGMPSQRLEVLLDDWCHPMIRCAKRCGCRPMTARTSRSVCTS